MSLSKIFNLFELKSKVKTFLFVDFTIKLTKLLDDKFRFSIRDAVNIT